MTRQLRFVHADAGRAASYRGIVPADLVVLSGFVGHIHSRDVPKLIESLPMLCRNGGGVIWNKHLEANDGRTLVPVIRQWLERANFAEIHFKALAEAINTILRQARG